MRQLHNTSRPGIRMMWTSPMTDDPVTPDVSSPREQAAGGAGDRDAGSPTGDEGRDALVERIAKWLYDEAYHPAMADDREWGDLADTDGLRLRFLRRADAILGSDWLAEQLAQAREAAWDECAGTVIQALSEADIGRVNEPGDWKRGLRRGRVAAKHAVEHNPHRDRAARQATT